MIRLKSLNEENLIHVLSGVFHAPTTAATYLYIKDVLSIYSVDESVTELYCILSALENLYEIFSLRRTVPTINKEVIVQIIENNLYGELKENTKAGFRQYAKINCNTELDVFNEEAIALVYRALLSSINSLLDSAIALGFKVEDSVAYLPTFLTHFGDSLAKELSDIVSLLNTNDSKVLSFQFWGWSDFFYKHKIRGIFDLPKLLRLVASYYDEKMYLVTKETAPLTSLDQLLLLEEDYIKLDTPLGLWEVPALDEMIRLTPHDVTILVGERGLGKTTLGGFLAGSLMAQGKKVLFYCPEIMKHKLIFNFILPAYIMAKYKFLVTPEQCLGLEPPYEYGSDLTAEMKVDAIKLAKLEFAESGLLFHMDRHLMVNTVTEDLRSQIIAFEPDVLIFDHTLELRGDTDMNKVTQKLAESFEELKKEFPIHIVALSHTGSDFSTPTKEKPIITSKIVAWSRRMEGVADNIAGAFSANGCINIFFTKLRWAQLMPMYLVFRMDRKHSWFKFRPEDQFSAQIDEEQIARLTRLATDTSLYVSPDEAGDEDDYFTLDD